ncbi:MAG: magnesium transporter [Oceanicoccus sp.]|jgi:magnesium transporter
MVRVNLVKAGKMRQGGQELLDSYDSNNGDCIWVDVCGDIMPDKIATHFGIHDLSIADAQRKRHPPKVEQFSNYVYLLQRGIKVFDADLTFEHVQVSLFVGKQFMITFHHSDSLSVNAWWQNSQTEHYLSTTPILLASRILNTMASRYLEVMLEFESTLSEIEDDLQSVLSDEVLMDLTSYRTRLRRLKRVFNYHEKSSITLMKIYQKLNLEDEVTYHLQDVVDKNERLNSLSQMYYELTGDLLDSMLSMASHKLNGTMRILTVITAVFVPLSFIVGLYGMNFDYIPELKFKYGYFMVVGFMLTLSVSLVSVFKFKKWL